MKKVRVMIEIPKGSSLKLEFNKERKVLELSRFLLFPTPYYYGFVPDTMWKDGDPLDVILAEPGPELYPGIELEVFPKGVIKMIDDGESDYKLLTTFRENYVIPDVIVDKYVHYLKTYKQNVVIEGVTFDESEVKETVDLAFSLGNL